MDKRLAQIALSFVFVVAVRRPARAEENFNRHRVVLDSSGKLLSWAEPQATAYDRVMRLAWDFLLTAVPVESNGLKTYFTHCCIDQIKLRGDKWVHNPAGLYAMLVDSATAYYPYSGDRRVLNLVQELLDYQLAHGTTPANWAWPSVPFASSDPGATEYRGAHDLLYDHKKRPGRGDGLGVIEPDKLGELGVGYLKYYELTADTRYRDAALACANALARHARSGDETNSPWPFRVYGETNIAREEYSANVIGPIRLFDELSRLNLGDVPAYRKARQIAWIWLVRYPLQNGMWAGYFEDVPTAEDITTDGKPKNFNQYSPLETARYLLLHPEVDTEWKTRVPKLIHLVESKLGVDVPGEPGMQWGAQTISEQLVDMHKMGSHTSRYASVCALWYEKTGETSAKEKSFRSFNWATYMCHENGAVNDLAASDQTIWFSDGYGDYVRHFMSGVGSVPEWAPRGESHLLRSSSVVQKVSYADRNVAYRTFDSAAEEVLRLNFKPTRVEAGSAALTERQDLKKEDGYTLQALSGNDYAVRVRHTKSGEVRLAGR